MAAPKLQDKPQEENTQKAEENFSRSTQRKRCACECVCEASASERVGESVDVLKQLH